MRRVRRSVAWLFRTRREIVDDVDAEIAFHLEMRASALEATGLTPAAAAEQARREFGDVADLRASLEHSDRHRQRRVRAGMWLDDLRQDVRFALRSLHRAPGFAAAALGTLVLGIGASVATFAVLNAVVLRPLPYAEPDRLVSVQYGGSANITVAEEIARRVPSLSAVTALSEWGLTLTGAGDAAELSAQVVEPAFFYMFAPPAHGRAFREEEREDGRSDVVVISDALWRERFGADPGVIGRRIDLDGYGQRARTVLGVMPRDFTAPFSSSAAPVHVWIPLRSMAARTVSTDSTWYLSAIIGQLAPGATVAGAAADVRAAMGALRAENSVIGEESVRTAGAASLLDGMIGGTRATLWLLLGAVALVLALACANLANLLLARGDRRRAELAARAALGGTRSRLIRELLTESAVLAVTGAAAGMLLARVLLDALRVADVSGLPRSADLGFDLRVTAFTTLAAIASVLLFGVLPALRATRHALRPELAQSGRVRGPSRGSRRFGAALIGGEVALAMVLVTGAALLIASFRSIRSVDPGLDPADVLTVRVAPAQTDYTPERARIFYDALLERIESLPGVRTAAAIQLLPFTPGNWNFPYLAAGQAPPANAPLPSANFRVVTPAYFDALDIPLLAGRTFDGGDRSDTEAVGVINRAFAELLWPGEDALGREVLLFGNTPFRVIGVVGDVRQHSLLESARPEMYRPQSQWTLTALNLMIEHDGGSAALESAVRAAVRALDPNVPVVSSLPLDEVLGESLAQRRFFMRVLSAFGAVALLLGAVGVYGVMSYSAGARVSEYGVRIALGATQRAVERRAFAEGMRPVLIGLGAGVLAALAAGRLLESMIYDVQPHDPRVIAASALVLAVVAALASWLPARRSSRVQPMQVLGSQ
jgi:putative ABC transport system permease protein